MLLKDGLCSSQLMMSHSLFHTYFRETHKRTRRVLKNCRRELITLGFVSDTDADSSSECTFQLYCNEDWRVAQCTHPSEPSLGWIRHLARADVFQFRSETKKDERPECAVQWHEPHTVKWQYMRDMLEWKRMLNKIHKCPRRKESSVGFPHWCSLNTKHVNQTTESALPHSFTVHSFSITLIL